MVKYLEINKLSVKASSQECQGSWRAVALAADPRAGPGGWEWLEVRHMRIEAH